MIILGTLYLNLDQPELGFSYSADLKESGPEAIKDIAVGSVKLFEQMANKFAQEAEAQPDQAAPQA